MSLLHSNIKLPDGVKLSEPVNENVALVIVLGFAGKDVIDVSGAATSVKVAVRDALPWIMMVCGLVEPVRSPPQAENAHPGPGTASSWTISPKK